MSHSDTRGTIRELRADLADIPAHRDRRNWNAIGNKNTRVATRVFKRKRRRTERYAGKHRMRNEEQE